MPPKPSVRANGKNKPKPKVTPADRVRLEWAGFETWLAAQRKEAEVQNEVRGRVLWQQIESNKRTLPKGFHPTLTKEFEEGMQKIAYETGSELVHRSRDEWERRLETAGLKAEDWDPMTLAEQEAVQSALAGLSDEEEEEDFAAHESLETGEYSAPHQFAANTLRTGSYLEGPSFSKLVSDADRTKSLSPLPDLPDCFRPHTPNRAPPTPSYTPGPTALFGETKPLGTRYTGPVLIEENKDESTDDADFAKFKMLIREQMIREFHEEAATLEIDLVRKEHEVKLKADAVKALVAGHELNMEELRRQKEDKRKVLVDAERTKRQAEIRRRNSKQPELAMRTQTISQPKGQARASGHSKQMSYTINETHPAPAVRAEKESAAPDIPGSSNLYGTGKKETKKQKNTTKASKKAAGSRVQPPNPETGVPSEKQVSGEDPVQISWSSEQNSKIPTTKLRGMLKDPINKKPTIEEVSDAEADSMIEPWRAPQKSQTSGFSGIFAEPHRAPSTHPFGSDDDNPPHPARPAEISESKKTKRIAKWPPPRQQTETTTMEKPIFSDGDENQSYCMEQQRDIEQQQGDVSESSRSSGGKHTLWAPPAYHDDSEDEDEGGALFASLALAGSTSVDNVSNTPWARSGPYYEASGPNLMENLNVAGKADSRIRYVPNKWGSNNTRKETSSENSTSEPGALDDTNWEAAMMGKFFGLAHNSMHYA